MRRLLCFALLACLIAALGSPLAAAEDATAPTAGVEALPETPLDADSAGDTAADDGADESLSNGMVDTSEGSPVVELQEKLIALGLLTGTADGHFGSGTEEAVLLFQQMYGLAATGVADPQTQAALSVAQIGVSDIQEKLIYVGVLSGTSDGVLSDATKEAIRVFQQMYGLEATGVADPQTRELLFSESNLFFGIQTKLIELTYLTGSADGVLGPATKQAITDFQQVHGLEATGVADPQTRELLLGGGSSLTPKPTPTPSPRANGAQGADIELAQQRLAEWGFLEGEVDGHYGDGTEKAVKAFKTYQYEDYLAYREANPTPTPVPTPTPTPQPTPSLAPGELPMVIDATLEPTPSPTPSPTPYAPDGEIEDSTLEFFKADTFEVYRQTVQNGDKGREVERVQRRLHNLNYLYSADGSFGSLTENALKYFQYKNNLDQTGIADEKTQRALFSPQAIAGEEYVFPYKLKIDLSDRRVYVYGWTGTDYSAQIGSFKCAVGAADTPTPTGTYQSGGPIGGRWYYFDEFDCYAQYATRIVGGILFHSVTYSAPNERSGGSTSSLGRAASHGCVRLTVKDAKWIYDNCPFGTTVVIVP